jgi:hypothetical protein
MGMPLQNRVLPTGEIVAHPGRGLMMGNRGCLHGHGRELGVTRWRSPLWLCCVLDWRGRRRDPMPPGRWTALFFLDEATALSAGHRPCAYCRRGDYLGFATAWQTARSLDSRPRAGELDRVLHHERVDRRRRKLTHQARIADLPAGVMIRSAGTTSLYLDGRLLPWSFDGYGPPVSPGPGDAEVEVLTPPSIVAAIAAGYRPLIHPSALPAPLATPAPPVLSAPPATLAPLATPASSASPNSPEATVPPGVRVHPGAGHPPASLAGQPAR